MLFTFHILLSCRSVTTNRNRVGRMIFRAGALYVQPENLRPWEILNDVKPLAGKPRVWVILIHSEGGEFDAGQFTQAAFDEIGRASTGMTHTETGAMVYLYDCAAGG